MLYKIKFIIDTVETSRGIEKVVWSPPITFCVEKRKWGCENVIWNCAVTMHTPAESAGKSA